MYLLADAANPKERGRLIKSTCTEDAIKTSRHLCLQIMFPRKEEEKGKPKKNPTLQTINKTKLFRAITRGKKLNLNSIILHSITTFNDAKLIILMVNTVQKQSNTTAFPNQAKIPEEMLPKF